MAAVVAAPFEQEDIFGSSAFLPSAPEDRNVLLEDRECLRLICESLYGHYKTKQGGVETRVAGRIACDLHRELDLELPSDDVLHHALMSHTTGGSSTLCCSDFSCFIEDVLSQCLKGSSFGSQVVALGSEEDEGCTVERQPTGEIEVHACTLDGGICTFKIDDKNMVQDLQDRVEKLIGIPKILQRLVLGSAVLKGNAPIYSQGILDQSMITILRVKPQATLLRTRKAFLGNTALPVKNKGAATLDGEVRANAKRTRGGSIARAPSKSKDSAKLADGTNSSKTMAKKTRSDSTTRARPRKTDESHSNVREESSGSAPPASAGKPREAVPDVRIRRVKLGKL